MTIQGENLLEDVIARRVFDAKMVLNESGVIVFSAKQQHRDVKGDGISYEDNYRGNALAAIVRRDAIEIRYHSGFDDKAVAQLMRCLLAMPQFAGWKNASVTHQGRSVVIEEPKSS